MNRMDRTWAWLDQQRLWLFAIVIALGVTSVLLHQSGQYVGIVVHVTTAAVPIGLALIITARAYVSSRVWRGLLVAALLVPTAVIDLFIEPANHPEVTALVLIAIASFFIVGLTIDLYSFTGITNRSP